MVHFSRRKSIALLAYLAVEPVVHARDSLCVLLWPECDQHHARGNLRSSLFEIVHVLGGSDLVCDQDRVELRAGALDVDVNRLLEVTARSRNGASLDPELLKAARGWAGGFMAGFTLEDCPDFDDWQIRWGIKTRKVYSEAARLLALATYAAGQNLTAEEMAARWIEAEPFCEEARKLHLSILLDMGDEEGARHHYENWTRTAMAELGRGPAEATRKLVSALLPPRIAGSVRNASRVAALQPRLFGRDALISALETRLLSGIRAFITLAGPGGVGKTVLARALQERIGPAFPGGAWFVDLAMETDACRMAFRIAATLGLRQSIGRTEGMEELLVSRLGATRCFLVLDNLEQMEGGAAALGPLVSACPGLCVLATSRSPVGLAGEEIQEVEPLPFPAPEKAHELGSIEDWPALELFLTRVRSVSQGGLPDIARLQDFARICERMDGLPLALELVAPLVAFLGPTESLERLERRIPVADAAGRDRETRHRSLDSLVEWSYDLLAETDQWLHARLAVFSGSFELESVEAILGEDFSNSFPEAELEGGILPVLERLVRNALVRREPEIPRTRFSFLLTIQDHACRKLETLSDRERLKDKTALHFLEKAEEASRNIHGAEQVELMHLLRRDERNFAESISRFAAGGQSTKALRLCRALDWYWFRSGMHAEACRLIDLALSAQDKGGGSCGGEHRGACLRALGWLRFTAGAWHEAHALYLEALALLEVSPDRREEARCLSDLGVVERWLGNRSGGDQRSLRALELANEENDGTLKAFTLVWHYGTRGGKPGSEEQGRGLEEAIRLARTADAPWILAHAHESLGEVLRVRGAFLEAVPHFQRALEGFRSLEDNWMQAWTQEGYGMTECAMGDLASGDERLRQSFALFFKLGCAGDAVFVLGEIALISARRQARDEADLLFGAFSALRGDLGLETLAMSFEAPARQEKDPGLNEALADARNGNSPGWRRGLRLAYDEIAAYLLSVPACNDPATAPVQNCVKEAHDA